MDTPGCLRAFHRDQQDGLDELFLAAVLACEAFVLQFPKGAPVVHKNQRQTPLKGSPYVMLFGVWNDELVIYRLFPTSQHPKQKFRRKK